MRSNILTPVKNKEALRMALFEGYERRIDRINAVIGEYGFKNIEETKDFCLGYGIDVEAIVKGVQPIAFENAVWAYTLAAP